MLTKQLLLRALHGGVGRVDRRLAGDHASLRHRRGDCHTSNNSHAEIAIDAFEHGKHVFCEKPLSHSIESAERMESAAVKSAKVNLVNFAYRCWPAMEFARQLIRRGDIGEPIHFEGHFFQDYAADKSLPFSWRFNRSLAGGGP